MFWLAGKSFKEITSLTIPTSVGDHCNATGHSVSLDNAKVLTREQQWTKTSLDQGFLLRSRNVVKTFQILSKVIPNFEKLFARRSREYVYVRVEGKWRDCRLRWRCSDTMKEYAGLAAEEARRLAKNRDT